MNRTNVITIWSLLLVLILCGYTNLTKSRQIAKLQEQVIAFANLEMQAQQSIWCLIWMPEYSKDWCDKFLVEYIKQWQALTARYK